MRKKIIIGGVIGAVLLIGGIAAATGNKASTTAGGTTTSSSSAAPTTTVDTAAVEASRQVVAAEAAKRAEASAAAKASADAKAAADAEAARVAAEAKAAADAEAARVAAEAAAAAAAADADLGSYQEPDEHAWALVAKDPAAHVGEKYVIYGRVFQFDSATGTSRFLANTGAQQKEYSFEYDTTTMVSATDPAKLADVVEDDIVKMYVKVTGPYSYSTRVGNGNTVTAAQVNTIEIVGHDD